MEEDHDGFSVLENAKLWPGEMTQQLLAFTALAEDGGVDPSTQWHLTMSITLVTKDLKFSSTLHQHKAHYHAHTYMNTKHSDIEEINLFLVKIV